jgi:hypothetical protein
MAPLFLFCSTKESRLCQAQISIRSNLNPSGIGYPPRHIRMELPRHPGSVAPGLQ